MRMLLVFLVVIALALGVGHYVIWQQQSALFEQQVAHIVDKLNKDAGSDVVRFTYDSKESGNYPESSITYVNPKISIDSGFYAKEDVQTAMTLHELSVDGKLTITNSFLQNKIMVETTGSAFISGMDMGEPYALKTSWKDAYQCSLISADSPIAFATGESKIDKAQSPAEFIKAMKSFECRLENISMINALNNQPLLDMAAYRVHLDSRPATTDPLHHIALDMQVDDALFYYSKEDYLRDMEMMVSSPDAFEASVLAALRQRDILPVLDSARAGKHDMRLRGYVETDLDKEEPLPFTLDMQEATVSNDFYSMEFPIYVGIKDNQAVTVRHKGVTRFTEAYDTVLRESLDILIEVGTDPALQMDAKMREKIANLDVDALRNLLPPLHEAGDIQTLANVSVENGEQADIQEVGLQTALYGITASGKVNTASNQVQQGVLTCTKCEGLITRLVNYGNQISRVMASVGEASQEIMISDAATQALIGFIKQLDTNKEDGEIVTITVDTDKNGMPSVSGQPAMVVMMQAMTTLAPHFPFLMPNMSEGSMEQPAVTPDANAE